jgi:hypothetical protein
MATPRLLLIIAISGSNLPVPSRWEVPLSLQFLSGSRLAALPYSPRSGES